MDEELDRWTRAGFVRRMSEAEAAAAPCVSPAFVSWDRLEKPRLVVDLRQVNEHLRGTKCKYEALFEFMSSFLPDDHLILWDIKDAYHHLYIHPNDRPYLNFTVGGHTYEAITMPFGLSVAPWAWTKITRPVLSALREAHFKLIGYVDDHGAAAPGRRPVSKRDGAAGFRKVALLYDKLGLSLHPSKGERQGTQQLTLLGYTIDKAGNAVRLPDVRVAKLRGGAAAILSSERKNRRWVRLKLLQSVAGIIFSGSLAIPEARLFSRSIYNHLAAADPAGGDCRLSHHSLRDLRYWANFGRHGHGRPIWAAPAAHTLHTDASSFGWGGVLYGGTPVRGHFAGASADWHINMKEVAAIRHTLSGLEERVNPGDRLRVVTDSRVALHMTNALVSRSPTLCAEVSRIHALAQDLGVTLESEWIPTTNNVRADKLRRAKESTDWQLDRMFFDALDSAYGPHTVDRFEPACNTRLPHYNSPLLDPTDLPANECSQPCGGGHNNWINPPFDRIPVVLDKIKTDGATATVILPVWTAQPWWAPALAAADEVCYLPRRAGLFFHAAGAEQAPRPHWTVCALRFTPGRRAQQRQLGPGRPPPSAGTRLVPGLAAPPPPRC